MKHKEETLDSIRVFLDKLSNLNIQSVNGAPFNQDFNDLFNQIVENKQVKIDIEIDGISRGVTVVVEDDTAFAVYDYHETFNELAQDIRNMQ